MQATHQIAGSKGGAGVWQRIVNEVPLSDVVVSAFLGHCGLLRHLALPPLAIGLDLDQAVIDWWKDRNRNVKVTLGCGIDFLRHYKRFLGEFEPRRVLVYCDPPYLRSVLRDPARRLYRYDLDAEGHKRLLDELHWLPCNVLINHPRCVMYDSALENWRRIEYRAMTRGGVMVDDCLWANYERPAELQDYSCVGANKRQREMVRRRCRNWVAALQRMGNHERGAVLAAVDAEFGGR